MKIVPECPFCKKDFSNIRELDRIDHFTYNECGLVPKREIKGKVIKIVQHALYK